MRGTLAIDSARAARAVPHRRRAPRAARADRRRRRRPARLLDGHMGGGPRMDAREARRSPRRGRGGRGRQPVGDARGRFPPRRTHRRPHRLRAERRLARRLPERPRRARGVAPAGGGRPAAGHGQARRLGRRGGSPLRPQPARIERRRRLDARPGRASPARRMPTVCALPGCARGPRSRARPDERRRQPARHGRRLPGAAHRAGPGAREHGPAARRGARHVRRGAPPRRVSRSGGPRRLDTDVRAPGRPRGRGASRARDPGDRRPGGRRGGVHDGQRRDEAGHRHVGGRRRPSACSTSATWTQTGSPRCWPTPGTASERFAAEERIDVSWERIWGIEPILFDETLVGFCDEAIREVAGTSHRLPSGPLHDAAEVSRAGIPTVMLFVQSLRGLSHTKLEDTRPEHLELRVQALDRLARRRSSGWRPKPITAQ